MIKDHNPNKDWEEDWGHEDGMYYCRCMRCNEMFIGYKRRVVCKECDALPKTDPWDNWKPNKSFV